MSKEQPRKRSVFILSAVVTVLLLPVFFFTKLKKIKKEKKDSL